jgi:hypothetical protein
MYYEINVAKLNNKNEYVHFFATSPRSITSKDKLTEILKEFKVLFPSPKFNISASYHPEMSEGLDVEELINKRIWSEIRNDFESDGIVFIDAWVTNDANEAGKTIAKIDKTTKKVEYIDKRAITDTYAQEIINQTLYD